MSIDRFTISRIRRFELCRRLMFLLALFATLLPMQLYARQTDNADQSDLVSIDVKLDRTNALVAERIQLEISATAPQGVTVKFPALQNQLGEFEIVSVKDVLDLPEGSNRKWIRRLGLESLISGRIEVPAIEIGYIDRRNGQSVIGSQSTPAQQVTIGSTLEGVQDPTQFRDIKSVVYAPEPNPRFGNWVFWAAGATGVLAIAALTFVMVRRKSELSPRHWAIKSLHELRASQPCQDENAEQVYIRLVDILRSFVYWQWGISAPRLTTHEFLGAIQADDRLTPEFRSELQELLKMADMIKFAGMLPNGTGLTSVVDQAIGLVENAADAESDATKIMDAQSKSTLRSSELPPNKEEN